MMCDLQFVWQVQLCEFVMVPLLTQSWTRSKCLVLSLVNNKLFFFFQGKLSSHLLYGQCISDAVLTTDVQLILLLIQLLNVWTLV